MGFQIRHGVIFFPVSRKSAFCFSKAVQIYAVLLFVQKLLAVMLAVDVQKVRTDLAKLGHRDRPSVGPADVFPVAADLPLEK